MQTRNRATPNGLLGDDQLGVAHGEKEICGQHPNYRVRFAIQYQALANDIGPAAEGLPVLVADHQYVAAKIGTGERAPERRLDL